MATDKVGLRTVEEFMADYTPSYQPIYPLFLGKSQAYAEEAGTAAFRRVNTIGDIRTKHVTPKDTEIRQVAASESSKTFKKYFLANQFQLSHMQGDQGVDDVVAQVLDEHQTQMDELFLLGEGTNESTMLNNSLFWSNDPNYVLEPSYEVKKDAGGSYLFDLHSKIVANVAKANRVSGRKLILFYGTNIVPQYNSLFANAVRPFKATLAETLGNNYSVAELPTDITPAGANGWIIANLDKVKLHYTALPALKAQGSNDEKMYYWFNFLMGSCMLEVLSSGGVVRQPATLQA
jgi:hypothetical protein